MSGKRRALEWFVISFIITSITSLRLYFMSQYQVCCSNDLLNYVLSAAPTKSVAPPAAALGQVFISSFGLRNGSMALTAFVGSVLMVVEYLSFKVFLKPVTAIASLAVSSVIWPINVLVSFNALDTYLGLIGWLGSIRSMRLVSTGGGRKQYYLLGLSLAFTLAFSLPSFGIAVLSVLMIILGHFRTRSCLRQFLSGFFRHSLPLGAAAGAYGALYWAQQFSLAGKGLLNTPNPSPFNLVGLSGVLTWLVTSYADPLWLVILIISVVESIRQFKGGDRFLVTLYLSVVAAIFTALYDFPDRVAIYIWVPILLGFGVSVERLWDADRYKKSVGSEQEDEATSELYITG